MTREEVGGRKMVLIQNDKIRYWIVLVESGESVYYLSAQSWDSEDEALAAAFPMKEPGRSLFVVPARNKDEARRVFEHRHCGGHSVRKVGVE